LTLQADDKDMIVMYHKFVTKINGETKQLISKMVCIGEDQIPQWQKTGITRAMATINTEW
jgi:hypothetical protein